MSLPSFSLQYRYILLPKRMFAFEYEHTNVTLDVTDCVGYFQSSHKYKRYVIL